MANKGEWAEPYVAIRILGDKKLYLADENGKKNLSEWMNILELIRHETKDRIVMYKYDQENVDIDIYVNNNKMISIAATEFFKMADVFSDEIKKGTGSSFDVSEKVKQFLEKIELRHIKARSVDKSDVFLSVQDPRSGIVRKHIGFSIKSQFGDNPTLFNTAKASAFIYELSGMNENLMKTINDIVDSKNHVAVQDRCDALLKNNCNPKFSGLPTASRTGCESFRENLDLIDPRLVTVIEKLLWNHFFKRESCVDLAPLITKTIAENPCELTRPEVKYPYMIKSFLYAAYCGMTASSLWDGVSQVNGGFIKVDASGEVLAHYALESDAFKTYLYENCYLEFPATDEKHGDYAKVYRVGKKYYFKLNFQIRYR